MPIMVLWVLAKSKADINRRLEKGDFVTGCNYSIRGKSHYTLNRELKIGTAIKVFSAWSYGNPVSKAYGTWNGTRVK